LRQTRRHPIGFLPAVLLVVLCFAPAFAERTLPDTGNYVEDQAQLLDLQSREQLSRMLAELRQKTGVEMRILAVESTDGEEPDVFVQRHADLWELGSASRNGGVLILVAVQEREARIHTVGDLEAALPEPFRIGIIRDVFEPSFEAGEVSQGIVEGTTKVAERIAGIHQQTLAYIPTGGAASDAMSDVESPDIPVGSRPATAIPMWLKGLAALVISLTFVLIFFILVRRMHEAARARQQENQEQS
jgi:uncharacterized membrane protein YgcG